MSSKVFTWVASKERHPESSATDSSCSGIRTLVFEATPHASPDNQRLESRLPANWESSPVYLDSETAATLLSDPANLEAATLIPNICVIDSQRRSAATLQLASGFRMTG